MHVIIREYPNKAGWGMAHKVGTGHVLGSQIRVEELILSCLLAGVGWTVLPGIGRMP